MNNRACVILFQCSQVIIFVLNYLTSFFLKKRYPYLLSHVLNYLGSKICDLFKTVEITSSSGGESFEGFGENENTESGVELDLPPQDMNSTVIGLVG